MRATKSTNARRRAYMRDGRNVCTRTLDERVVEEEEQGPDVVRELGAAEQALADVDDIADLRVYQAVLPEVEGGVERRGGDTEGDEDAWHYAEDRVRPWEGENGQTDVF